MEFVQLNICILKTQIVKHSCWVNDRPHMSDTCSTSLPKCQASDINTSQFRHLNEFNEKPQLKNWRVMVGKPLLLLLISGHLNLHTDDQVLYQNTKTNVGD